MKTCLVFGMLVGVLALTSAASANVVVNGDFEGGTYVHPVYGYNCPIGWDWYYQSAGGTGTGRIYPASGMGPDGSNAHRLQVVSNSHAKTVMYQVIDTVPGETYAMSAQWMSGIAKPDRNDNEYLSWGGAFFFDDNGTDTAQAQIDAFVPDVTGYSEQYPHRFSTGDPLTSAPTDRILPPNHEIVAEHAEDYGSPFNNWETIYDGAGGAGDPTMPGIGELAGDGGGAAWQTKVATGDHMIVGFFTLDTPSTNGGASILYLDNVVVVPEPTALALLALGMAWWMRARPSGRGPRADRVCV